MTDESTTTAATPAAQEPIDVFVSYAREDRDTAARLAEALTAQGLVVWWDRDLRTGSEFSEVIEAQLTSARAVLVLWSAESVRSAFVRDESAHALRSGKLLPLRIEDIELPLGFGQIHTLDLIDWDGDADDETFQQLLHDVRRLQGQVASSGEKRRLHLWKLRRYALGALIAALLAALGYGGKVAWDKEEADSHFRSGLEHQHAKEPELVPALNEYLSALDRRPRHARARYYLAHVYVQNNQPADALASFQLALASSEAPLDNGQRAEAEKQIAALSVEPNEPAPVARSVASLAPRAGGAPLPDMSRGIGRAPEPVPEPSEPRKPPRIEPPAAVLARVASQVEGMYDENKDQRITATTSLIVDPEALSDAVPVAVSKALAVLRAPGAALTPRASSGVVNTLVLLQSALPGTLEVHRAAIEELVGAAKSQGDYTRQQAAKVDALLKLAATRKPVAYLQLASEAQRPLADALIARFRSFGYEAPAVEVVGARAPARTELRVQGKSDRGYARWVAKVIGEVSGEAPAVLTLRNAKPRADTYEIWLDRDLCITRPVPACSAP